MAVSGDLAAVVKVVEHSELQGEFMLVGRNLSSVHGQGRIAVTGWQVARGSDRRCDFL